MAITLDTTGAIAVAITESTATLSYTLATGAQLWVLTLGSGFDATVPDVTSVVYNGVSMSPYRSNSDGVQTRLKTFESFDEPLTGDGAAHNLVVIWDRALLSGWIVAASFLGTGSVELGNGTSGNDTIPTSGSLAPAAGALVVDAVGNDFPQTPIANGSQATIASGNNSVLGYGISTRAGGSTFSMDWSLGTSSRWLSHSLIVLPATSSIVPQAMASYRRRRT